MPKQLNLFPLKPIDFISDRKGNDKCPHCGETKVTDCIHDKLTFICGASGHFGKVDTECKKDYWTKFFS